MPSTSARQLLKPPGFFAGLRKKMADTGLVLMYQFESNTKRDTYHVPASYAHEVTNIFYQPGAGFVLKLSFTERIDATTDRHESWWTGEIYLSLNVTAMIQYEATEICPTHRASGLLQGGCAPLDHVFEPFDSLMAPFRIGSGFQGGDDRGSYLYPLTCEDDLTIDQLVTVAKRVMEHFEQFFLPKFGDFDAFGFTDTYAWPDIQERFWRGFPTSLLRECVVGRIRGREKHT